MQEYFEDTASARDVPLAGTRVGCTDQDDKIVVTSLSFPRRTGNACYVLDRFRFDEFVARSSRIFLLRSFAESFVEAKKMK